MNTTIDVTDSQILAHYQAAFDQHPGPRVGDCILFADGVERRISDNWNGNYQTSDDGQWFLGNGYMSFSGALYPTVWGGTVTFTGETRSASAWFFHHNQRRAHNGIDVQVTVRIYSSTAPAPR